MSLPRRNRSHSDTPPSYNRAVGFSDETSSYHSARCTSQYLNLFAGTSKSTDPPLSLTQTLNLNHRRRINLLQDKLGNPVSLRDLEINVRMIEQEHFQWAAIVLVNDTGTGINEVLDRW
jgi:hypothetical protein